MPSGAPKGNRNARKGKDWTDALKYVLESGKFEGIKKGQALREIARKTVLLAIEGDRAAREEIANRLDGKPHQSLGVEITPVADHTRTELEAQLIALGVDPEQVRDGRTVN